MLVPLRALSDGEGTDIETAEAFDWAGDHGIRVVNASLGGAAFSQAEYDAIAGHPQTLYVVAAGNDSQDVDETPAYPCAYALDNVLCVGATDQNDDLATEFSNYGENSVDVFAPGVFIVSTRAGQYYVSEGTSMATPHVAGAAALLLARNPALTAGTIKSALLDNADPEHGLEGLSVSGARSNANASLLAVPEDPDAAPVLVSDIDADGVPDAADNCPGGANADQSDADGDGTGDLCDTDRDGDGRTNGADNCPTVSNAGQADADRDAFGDVCDLSPRGHDNDRDGKAAIDDVCPDVYGTLAKDARRRLRRPTRTATTASTPRTPARPNTRSRMMAAQSRRSPRCRPE